MVAINGGSSQANQTRGGPQRRPLEASNLEHTKGVGQNPPVGFNPFRQQRRRSTDYVMVAAAFAVVAVLLIWAVYPR
jgi:hypothetical protein